MDQSLKNFHNRYQKPTTTAVRVISVVWVVCFLLSLSFMGGIAYVAYHFLSKVW